MRESTDYRRAVSNPYQVFNGIFLTLPLDGIRKTGLRVPLLQEACENGLQTGKSPAQILEDFFRSQHLANSSEKAALLFRVIQYVERQVVLVDALEDAQFQRINELDGAESLQSLVQRVERHGLQDELVEILGRYAVRVVLTSHPTQFYPSHVLAIITDLAVAMANSDLDQIRILLHQLGLTPFFQSIAPTPYEEASRQIWYLENVFFDACSELAMRLADAVGRPDGNGLNHSVLRIGFWPGGDRDGNPYVDADTTRKVARKLKLTLLRCYRREFRKLQRQITFKGVDQELEQLRQMTEAAILDPYDTALNQEVLLRGLGALEERVEREFNGLYLEELRQMKYRVQMFGMHFASLDLRQDARVVTAAFKAMIGETKNAQLEAMTSADRLGALMSWDTVFDGKLENDRHQDVLECLGVLMEIQKYNGEPGCHRFILSNCKGAEHIATLYAMARAAGWKGQLSFDMVPLFESIADLDRAQDEMSTLYSNELYSKHLDGRGGQQTVMLGFSDGTKDGGYLRANWSIYQAKTRLTEVSRNFNRIVHFFDGRGGPPARGGGNTHRFYASLGPNIENHEIQTTVQGQTISSNYGTRLSAGFNLELLLTAGVKNSLFDHEETRISEAEAALLQELGESSYQYYMELRERPEFVDYLATYGTLKYYGATNIGSRPTSRAKDGAINFGDLRAIPFVGSWSQLKQNVPGYFGLGTALEKLDSEGRLQEARDLFERNAFFRTLVENSMQSMTKCDFRLTAHLQSHPRYGDLWSTVHEEYQRTRQMVLKISEQEELMQSVPAIRESIRLRDGIILPLLVIQQFALAELAARETEEGGSMQWSEEQLKKLVIRSMYGIVNASRNAV